MTYPQIINKLIKSFLILPGVGPRTAERYVFCLLKQKQEDIFLLAQLLIELKEQIKECKLCNCLAENEICTICLDKNRDKKILCIVSDARDMLTIESTRKHSGIYFNLGQTIEISKGINSNHLAIEKLLEYIKKTTPTEIILAFNPNIEGETTAMYIAKKLKTYNLKITKLARGLPMGSNLEYTDETTLNNAFKYRNIMN